MKTIHFLFTVMLAFTPACAASDETHRPDNPDPETMQTLVAGNSAFAFDLYGQLTGAEGNLFLSPFSISTALAMTAAGAGGQTAEQMAHTLHFDGASDRVHPAFGHLLAALNDPNRSEAYQLSVANALWAQQGFPFSERFMNINRQYYHAGLENVDFIRAAEQTRQTINAWVEDKTEDKIKDLLPAGSLDAMTRLVLTNAIYFKGQWAKPFQAEQTTEQPFYITPEKTVTASLMMLEERFKYAETDALQIVELPYTDDELSMLVLLPKGKDGLAALEAQLTAEDLAAWHQQMRNKEIKLYLPKFTMTSEFSLAQTLAAMGMPDAFSGAADFSGMTGTKDLFISDVIHKAFVEVNEEGTEAAAATGIVMRLTAVPAPPPVFRADHPFVFVIKDNKTGSLLFVGRVADPTKEQ